MEYRKRVRHTLFLAALFALTACLKDYDLSGFIYSADRSNERFEQSMAWNRLHPRQDIIVDSDNYTFLAGGDSHCGSTTNLDIFIEKVLEPEISFSLIIGDMSSGSDYDYITVFRHMMRMTPIPSFMTVGNHDLYFDGWTSYRKYFGSSTYSFKVVSPDGTDLFICLDTGTGTLGTKQMKWLKETLVNSRSSCRNCIVFTHVNFFREHQTLSTNPLVEELYSLLDLFVDYRVNMVIMGHDHKRSVEVFGTTHYITLDALEDEADNASYLRIINKKGKLGYEFIEVD